MVYKEKVKKKKKNWGGGGGVGGGTDMVLGKKVAGSLVQVRMIF